MMGWRKLVGALVVVVLIFVYGWFQMESEAGHMETIKHMAYVAIGLMAGNGIAAIGNALGNRK